MSLRSPLGRVRGLGSAKNGVSHFIAQRLSAIALVPLCLWFVISVIRLAHAGGFDAYKAWVSSSVNAGLLVTLVGTALFHAQLGLQVVIEDYVHCECKKLASLIAVKFAAVLLTVLSAVAVIRVAFVGG